MKHYREKLAELFVIKKIKKDKSNLNNMKKHKFNLSWWEWLLIIFSIILEIFIISKGKYDFALSSGITMFLIIILVRVLKIDLKEKDYEKTEKKIELNKLRLSKYETLSISLISIGVGIFVAGQTSLGNISNINTWSGLGMVIVGILIEKFHVQTRYKVLEDFYEKTEKEKIK